jgi:hypothetical protein
MGCVSGAVGTGRWEAAGAGRRIVVGRERTTVPGVKGGTLPGRILFMRNMTTPLGSGGSTAGRPTARKAELPQRAQDDPGSEGRQPKRRQETGNRVAGTSAGWIPHNWSDTGVLPGPKGS